ncbi:MAG TPA: tRNA pseudouridine(55) synthase TruB [Herpetosiphonaceae bacterium]
MTVHGFLNIDKPAGMTSHDVVAKVRRLVAQKRVGHGGTLDPAATGVLPVALGEATRLVEYLVEGRKRYLAEVRLGITTTTDDAEGETLREQPVPPLSHDDLTRAVQPFIGTIRQVPPMYSAIQVAGQRMYDLARQGKTVDLEPRTVEVDRIEVLAWEPSLLTLDVLCGKGTYIRSLARDLGAALGCGAHLAALRRTQVGPLGIESAVPLGVLLDDPSRVSHHLLPPATAVADWPRADVDDATVRRIRNGLAVRLWVQGELARAHAPDGRLVALLRLDSGLWQPFKVFTWG